MQQKVVSWLRNEGYPLEMEVAKVFKDAGFVVQQAEFYNDTETGKSREIDVTAFLSRDKSDGKVLFSVDTRCCIECKLSSDKPWVLFTSEVSPWWQSHVFVSSGFGKKFLEAPGYYFEQVRKSSLIKNKPIGHQLAQALSKGIDIPFQAIQSAVKASIAVASQDKDPPGLSAETKLVFIKIVLPIIIFDNSLFEAYLDKRGDLVVNEIESGIVYWEGDVLNKCLVHVLPKKSLFALPSQVVDFVEAILGCDSAFHKIGHELDRPKRRIR